MQTIVLASGNKDKAIEIKEMLNHEYEVKTMGEVGINIDIVEDGQTFEENANIKMRAIQKYIKDENIIIIADDSGLCVDALEGSPGIYSARYAGEDVSYKDNNEKLLKVMENIKKEERGAAFVCAVGLILPGNREYMVRGTVRGEIAFDFMGEEGFGYDPLFIVEGTGKSYAQMTQQEKNERSHRALAIKQAKTILEKNQI